MRMSTATVTPAMRQYLEAKRQFRDAIVFFRMGDFYEMFYEDALVASRALELTLTSRSKDAGGAGIPMCGIPYHAADGYLTRLVKKGFRVAICEQTEDPKKAKGLVRREVVRVVSPGTLTDTGYLEAREPTLLMALAVHRTGSEQAVGVAVVDVSTGECTTAEYLGTPGLQALADELMILRPREVVLAAESPIPAMLPEFDKLKLSVTQADSWTFEYDAARRTLLDQLRVHGLEGFGLDTRPAAVCATGALFAYLRDTQKADLSHIRTVRYKAAGDSLLIDPVTMKHLEVVSGADGTTDGSLLKELDRTVTSMGARLLRSWLLRPLAAIEPIRDRLDAVEELAFQATGRARCREALKAIHDMERVVGRAALGTVSARELVALRLSLAAIPRLKSVLADFRAPLIQSLFASLDELTDLRDEIERTLVDEPPALVRDGGFTRDGVDAALDELKSISRSGRRVIAEMEESERQRTGIASLKVRFNRVFGYYIEISKSNLHAVPDDYHRKQTIAGGERFTTVPLKEYEEKVLGADERILSRELEIFEALRARVAGDAGRVQDTARALSAIDVLAALAETAAIANYTKPHVHDGDEFLVTDARHPVVERMADAFVPNDIDLNGSTRQLVILTGPNMGGKSTYLRQTALIPLLAQIGSFVPARDAKVPLVDRIFARVGASDNIARGQSTFMVEMQETANILHTATSRSLVVLDEIGRGTATFDGLSIAWAVAEYLATNASARPKTIFATHYHEMTDLADAVAGVVNAHVSAREWKDEIVFLRKIVPGRSDRSYGIQVARLAGLPPSVVARAKEILNGLERDELSRGGKPTLSGAPGDIVGAQLGLFAAPTAETAADPRLRAALKAIDVDDITPRRALELIAELQRLAGSD
jgi:DNA mismatch repair protein MutS